jgi:hypothetical protein
MKGEYDGESLTVKGILLGEEAFWEQDIFVREFGWRWLV